MDAKTLNEIRRIVDLVCQRYGVTPEEIYAKRGKERIVTPRKIVSALIRDIYGYKISYTQLGWFFNRPHCTVIYYVKSAHNRCDVDKEFRITYQQLLNDARLAINAKQKSTRELLTDSLEIDNISDLKATICEIIKTC